jgi:hypothetical protein
MARAINLRNRFIQFVRPASSGREVGFGVRPLVHQDDRRCGHFKRDLEVGIRRKAETNFRATQKFE